MKFSKFRQKIVFKRFDFIHCVGKMVNVNIERVERLIPLQTKKGAIYTFFIECNSNQFDNTILLMKDVIKDNTLAREFAKIYKFPPASVLIDINSLSFTKIIKVHKVKGDKNSNTNKRDSFMIEKITSENIASSIANSDENVANVANVGTTGSNKISVVSFSISDNSDGAGAARINSQQVNVASQARGEIRIGSVSSIGEANVNVNVEQHLGVEMMQRLPLQPVLTHSATPSGAGVGDYEPPLKYNENEDGNNGEIGRDKAQRVDQQRVTVSHEAEGDIEIVS